MEIVSGPFADFCTITFPAESFAEASAAVLGVLTSAGGFSEREGLIRVGDGTVTHKLRYRVGVVSASGGALSALRSAGLFQDFLWSVGSVPHRVSTLHAALDVAADGARSISRVHRRALRGVVRFTRKAVPVSQVRRLLGRCRVTGQETGTVYLGDRKRDVWAKVYDKRAEVVDKAVRLHGESPEVVALNDPGPLTRYELALGRHVGCSLADVEDPAAVFWHFAGGVLLDAPPGVAAWTAHGGGFELGRPRERCPWEQLELLLSRSADVRRLVELADRASPQHGRVILARKLVEYVLPGSGLGTAEPRGV